MTNEDSRPSALSGLPPELAELDAELSSIRLEPRPSHEPELRAELSRAWLAAPPRLPGRSSSRLAAAAVASLLLVGLVSPARASLARLLGTMPDDPVEASEPAPSPPSGVVPPFEISRDVDGAPEAEADVADPPDFTPPPEDAAPFERVSYTFPEIADRASEAALIRRYYPVDLQRAGIGGVVKLRLWVGESGRVDFVNMQQGSGVSELDRAAMRVGNELRFVPATQRGKALGTWVEFDLIFDPEPAEGPLPTVAPLDDPPAPGGLDRVTTPAWEGDVVIASPVAVEAEEMLRVAFGDTREDIERRYGPLEGILLGEPAAGSTPIRWRNEVTGALDEARTRDPENPAPYLALARIRRKQGLRGNAALLLDEALARIERGSRPVAPSLVADLHFERGTLLRDSWLVWRDLGSISASTAAEARCPQGPGGALAANGLVSIERLIAWNYLCPTEFDAVMSEGFQPSEAGAQEGREVLREYEAAVDAYPGHVGANVEVLLALADERRWYDLLEGARRFAWASNGHPYALLLSGLALQRLGRSDEAMDDFRAALSALPDHERDRLLDVRTLMDRDAALIQGGLPPGRRAEEVAAFWLPLDPILVTDVNEREVEHLARTAYAELRLGGADTDAGALWVRYGAPNTIRTLGAGTELRTEFWDYGRGPDITFRRPSTSDERDLTPEAGTYLEELRQVLAHRYGTRARQVYSLPARVARFRSGLGAELEIAAEVPPMFAKLGVDSLDLGLFLVDADGTRTEVERGRIGASLPSVRLKAAADQRARRLVLELYDEGSGRAAAFRAPVFRGENGESARISDVLLLAPAEPEDRDISRADPWVEPLEVAGPVARSAVGLYFELYGVLRHETPYKVSVTRIENGQATPLPIRPAGQRLFGPEWSRVPLEGRDAVREFLTVDLADVVGGAHTLELVVKLADGAVLRERLDLDVDAGAGERDEGGGLESGAG